MAAVRLQHVTKKFKDGPAAVAGLTLDVKVGEFLVLVGPSGCGKTTALRLVAGLELPTSGRILIDGVDVTDLPPGSRDVAMVFQNYALYPHFTVAENIAFPLRMRGVAPRDRRKRAAEVAGTLGIAEYLNRKPAELSGGQRQRVALARAIVREPAVFLFDEPLSNLDAQVRAATRGELVNLHRKLGTTMIYVTHDQVEAMSMAQRLAVMNQGKLEQLGTPMEVYNTPATLFSASFIGSPAVNSLEGRVEGRGAHETFVGALRIPVAAAVGGEATVAIRPEHVRVSADGEGYQATVIRTESLGPESVVHLKIPAGFDITARISGQSRFEDGAEVKVTFEPAGVLVFDELGRLAGRGRA